MAHFRAAHGQSRVHVDVVAGQVKGDQSLEDDGPARKGRRQEHQQARRGAAIGHHVQHSTKSGRLFEVAGGVAIEGIEQAGHAVEHRAGSRV